MKPTRYLPGMAFFLLLVMAACTPLASASEDPTPIVVEIQPVEPSLTVEPSPTDTPEPTPTFTLEPTRTPEPTSTPMPNIRATQEAEQVAARQDLEVEIRAELAELDLVLERGRLAWSSERPVSLSLDTYNTFDNFPLGDGSGFSDFVLKADVTWESSGGLAICGFWLRGESYEENAARYQFQTIRLSGFPGWDVEYWKLRRWVSNVSPGGQVNTSPHINQDQGATNTVILVADGSLLTVYVNGNRLGRMTVSTLSEGVLGAYIYQESGETSCIWDDVWIWDLTAE
jgi:hypothetical protein